MCSTRQGFKDDLSLREMVSGVFFFSLFPQRFHQRKPQQIPLEYLGISSMSLEMLMAVYFFRANGQHLPKNTGGDSKSAFRSPKNAEHA